MYLSSFYVFVFIMCKERDSILHDALIKESKCLAIITA